MCVFVLYIIVRKYDMIMCLISLAFYEMYLVSFINKSELLLFTQVCKQVLIKSTYSWNFIKTRLRFDIHQKNMRGLYFSYYLQNKWID